MNTPLMCSNAYEYHSDSPSKRFASIDHSERTINRRGNHQPFDRESNATTNSKTPFDLMQPDVLISLLQIKCIGRPQFNLLREWMMMNPLYWLASYGNWKTHDLMWKKLEQRTKVFTSKSQNWRRRSPTSNPSSCRSVSLLQVDASRYKTAYFSPRNR